MANQPLGVGIIGMGFMGRSFAQICHQLAEARLVGVTDVIEETGRTAAESLGVPFFSDVEDLVNHRDLQAVIVATPEDAHVEPCIVALQKGKAVLVEKPLAHTSESALQIVTAAYQSKAILMVGHVLRFMTQYVMAKDMLDEGYIGALTCIQTRRLNGKSAQDRLKGRCSLPFFLGIHDYDIARWYARSEPIRVYAESQFGVLSSLGYNVEDTNWALISFENGVLAACETGWILPDGHPSRSDGRLSLQGSNGRIDVELLNQTMMLSTNERTLFPGTFFMPRVRGQIRGGFVDEVQHFLACVREDREPAITGKDALVAVKIAEAVIESARTHQPVEMRP